MSEEVRKLFRVKGRSPEECSSSGNTAASKRNIFQQCINYRRSTSSSPSFLSNHRLQQQHSLSHDDSPQKMKPSEPRPKPKLPPRPATVACAVASGRTCAPPLPPSSPSLHQRCAPVMVAAPTSQDFHQCQELIRPNSVPPLAELSSSVDSSCASLQSAASEQTQPSNVTIGELGLHLCRTNARPIANSGLIVLGLSGLGFEFEFKISDYKPKSLKSKTRN